MCRGIMCGDASGDGGWPSLTNEHGLALSVNRVVEIKGDGAGDGGSDKRAAGVWSDRRLASASGDTASELGVGVWSDCAGGCEEPPRMPVR